MTRARRVLCVTSDPAVSGRVRAALDDVVPETDLETSETATVPEVGAYSVAIVTDATDGTDGPDASDGSDGPDATDGETRDLVASLHADSPGLPILVAARNGSEALASDVLAAGATSYVPLDDGDRLRDRLDRLLSAERGYDGFLDHLVEHVGVGVGAYNRDGIITYANPAFADLLGLPVDELRGRQVCDINPELEVDRFDDYFASFDPGETRHTDARHVRADGTIVPVHTVTTRVDHAGTPLHLGTITDVSERVATQRKIEALHDVASALAEPDTVEGIHELVVDAADRILDLHACYFIDHRDDHFAVTASSNVAPVDDSTIPEGKGVVWATFDGGEPMLIDDIPEHPVAEPSHDRFRSAVSIPVGDHGVFQAVSTEPGTFTEEDLELADLLVTHATAALDRVHFAAAIRTERDRLAALFENVPNPVVEYEIGADASVIATDVNPAFESVFGYDADEFVGRDVDEAIVPPETEERARTFNRDLVAGQSVTAEVKRLTADGPRDFLLHVVPLTVDAENGGGYAIYTDITEQKQRERQLERQNDRLEEFASVVSHDLRNPLNVATGRLEMAAQTAEGETADDIAIARRGLERMDDLIGDLLRLAREGRSVGTTETVDLEHVARQAWASVETRDATLVVDDPPAIEADVDRVRQLLENLFRNSVEHGSTDDRDAARLDDSVEHAGPTVTVTVDGIDGGFEVRDDGPGMPPDVLERAFTSGFTTSDDGTGFGLSIVERIAGAHGWTVDLETGPGGGTTVRFHVTDPE